MSEWQHDAVKLANTGVMSWRDIAKHVGKSKSTVSDFLRDYFLFKTALDTCVQTLDNTSEHVFDSTMSREEVIVKFKEMVKESKVDNSRILVISDLHFPFSHPETFVFLQHLKDKYSPTRVIQVGDEIDGHACSYHESDPDLYSAGHELKRAKEDIKRLEEMFPNMDLLDSNHGSLVYRKAKTAGLPKDCIKSYNEILGVGDGWKWHNDLITTLPNGQRVYFCHGRSTDGLKLSKNMACNVVQGHYHSKFNTSYWSNPDNLFWSMQVGCLVDNNSLAMAYNKLTLDRPIIGCGLIIDSKPVLEYMNL